MIYLLENTFKSYDNSTWKWTFTIVAIAIILLAALLDYLKKKKEYENKNKSVINEENINSEESKQILDNEEIILKKKDE